MGNELRPRVGGYFVLLVVLGILLVGLDSQRAIAQTEKASVSGRITDQSNAAVPEAEVQIKNTDTGVATIVKTNGEGVYTLPSLNPGNYLMTVNKMGFRTVSVTGMTLNVQENLSRNFTLQIGSTAESVTVTAESGADLIQTTSSNLGTVIAQKAIHELPLSGRNFSPSARHKVRASESTISPISRCLPQASLNRQSRASSTGLTYICWME